MDQLWDLARMQLIAVEDPENLFYCVNEFERAQQLEAEQIRILQEDKHRLIVIKRKADASYVIRCYGNITRLERNRLVPIGAEQELFYDPGLELMNGAVQKLKTTANAQIRFAVTPNGVLAQFIAGFAFRQAQEVRLHNLREEPRIFYPLKRLERFYVNRPSDPYYAEVISELDRALHMHKSHAPGASAALLAAFDSGQIAFDQIFPDDKPLYTRLRELAKLLTSKGVSSRV
jgi:hypothetical protein